MTFKQPVWDQGTGKGDFYYASGTWTIYSWGDFTLLARKKADGRVLITATGTMRHRWYDCYDWHGNLGVEIDGDPVDDKFFLELKCAGFAKPFKMENK